MLAELAACNAAFAVIKQTVQNGKDLAACGKSIQSFVNGKQDLERKLNKKRKKLFGGNQDHDLEEFLGLEQIRQNEKELESYMKLYGRFNLHQDWVRFQADARKKRATEERERKQRITKIITSIIIVSLITVGLVSMAMIVSLIYISKN
tara:strand:- start:456 stop:902 length:447 start_codon:yes stop_codon:yes gene_type:complete